MAVRKDIVDSDKAIVEEVFNQLIDWVYEINFGAAERPVFSMWEEEEVDLDQATRDKTLSDAGVKFTKKYYMKAYGLEEEDLEIVPTGPQGPTGLKGLKGSVDGNQTQFVEPGNIGRWPLTAFPDQDAIDAAIVRLNPEEIQKQAEGILRPIIELIEGGHDYQEILGELAGTYPSLDDGALQEMLGRAIFVSEVWGRITAEGEKLRG